MLRDGRLIKLSWPCFQQINIGKRCVLTVRVPNFDPTPSTTGIPDVLVMACYGPVSIDGLDIERGRGKSSSNTVWHSRCKEFWGIIGIRIVLREGIQLVSTRMTLPGLIAQVRRVTRSDMFCPLSNLGFQEGSNTVTTRNLMALWSFFLVSWMHSFWNLLVGLNQTCATWRNWRTGHNCLAKSGAKWNASTMVTFGNMCIHFSSLFGTVAPHWSKKAVRHQTGINTFTLGYESKPSDLGYLVS